MADLRLIWIVAHAVGALITCPLAASAQDAAKPAPAGASKPIIVEGQVTDLMGGGLSGAEVVVRRKGEADGEGQVVGRATTDPFGDFAVTADPPVTGRIVVTVSKPKYVTLIREFELDGGEFPPFLADVLRGDVRVRGTVMSHEHRAPIADATVVVSAEDQEWPATTDDKGRFTVQGVPPGRGTVVATAHGYGREQRRIERLAEAGEIELLLQPGRTVTFVVRDDLGRPIPDALLECFTEGQDDYRAARTDDKGRIALEGFNADATGLELKLTHEAFVSDTGFERSVRFPDGIRPIEHEIIMRRAGSISGVVSDAATGEPLNGARVASGLVHSRSSPREWSDYRGRYEVTGVAPGETVVTVHLADYAPELAAVQVKAGETAPLDIKLKSAARVRGVVKDDQGNPLSGAFVDATRWRGYETLGLRAISRDDGTFVIENAPPDEFEVHVRARGMKEARLNVRAAPEPIAVVLEGDPAGASGRPSGSLKPGDAVPALTLITMDGTKVELAKLNGKIVVLDFWATWCGPCVADLPHMVDVFKEFGSRENFAMYGISLDYEEKSLLDFVKQRKIGWPQIFGEAGGADAAADAFGVVGIPAVFVVGADGKLVATDMMGSELADRIRKELDKSAEP